MMRFQKIRFWLASKILGGMVINEYDREVETKKLENQWMERQLKLGKPVYIEYEVNTIQ